MTTIRRVPRKPRPLRPGTPSYWAKYGAGSLLPGPGRADLLSIAPKVTLPAPGPPHTMDITGGPGYVAPDGQNPWTGSFTPPGGSFGKVTIPGAGGAAGAGSSNGAGAAASGNPWDSFLAEIERREAAARDAALARAAARARAQQAALAGFGQALQGNAAEQWGKVIESYGRAGEGATAFGGALTDSYGQGLTDANRQIAADFAAIGQHGPADIRDDAAALEQIRTQGGARPGEMAGLVGRAWGSYGETRPGSIGFMTGQNIMQSQREEAQAAADIEAEFLQAAADNPQQAMAMWQAVEEWKSAKTKAEADAAQLKIENELKQRESARQDAALKLQSSTVNRQWQQQLEDAAWNRTNATGKLWIVRNGRLVNTGRSAPGSAAGRAALSAATTARGQDLTAAAKAASLAEQQAHNRALEVMKNAQLGISQQQANTAAQRASAYARYQQWKMKHPNASKGPGGITAAQARQWGRDAGQLVYQYYNGVTKTNSDGTTTQLLRKQSATAAMKEMIGRGIPYQIAWKAIYQAASKQNSRWAGALKWNPKYKPGKKK